MNYRNEFQTKRLILRLWREQDAADCYEYARDPDVGPMAGWPPHTSVENSLWVIQNVLSEPGTYAICLKEDNRAIGSISLFPSSNNSCAKEGELEIGFWIGKPFWGKGYVPEAVRELQRYSFEELGCAVLWCAYWSINTRSRRTQEKCGFTYHHTEPHIHNTVMDDWRDHCVNILTKEQWEKNTPTSV